MGTAELIHLGGEHTVTGSCHLLRIDGLNVMIDCGLGQGDERVLSLEEWPVSPDALDYLFLTHAHIDHIGRLPELIAQGFGGEIICSHPTKALIGPMLEDAMKFGAQKKQESRRTLQSIDDLSWGFEYGQEFRLAKGISFQLGRAGHILGSAFIHFTLPDGFSILFSGDLGGTEAPLLPDPDRPPTCDLLVLESTYGNRDHQGKRDRLRRLGELLRHALADNGKVFIPAFALGRTQELLYELDRVFADKEWSESGRAPVPVFVDTPLGLKITEVYGSLTEYWDKEARTLLFRGDHPIDFAHLYSTARYHDHLQLLDLPGPAIIIAGSGMCSGGRIVDHLRAGLSDQRNDILFVGYQAEGTPGRDLLKYSKKPDGYLRLDGKRHPVRAAVHNLSGYSAHADQQGLLDWVESMPEKPKEIKLVHGEPGAQQALAAKLRERGYEVSC